MSPMLKVIGYGDNALFRQGLTAAGWQYVVAVKGSSPRAHPAGAVPQARPYGGLGQPPSPPAPARRRPCASSPSPAPMPSGRSPGGRAPRRPAETPTPP
jgi:hypothetical protein